MSPASILLFIKNVVSPVSFSPLIIAQLIGAAPLYFGSNDACKLKVPYTGIFHISSGSFLNAITIIIIEDYTGGIINVLLIQFHPAYKYNTKIIINKLLLMCGQQ